MAGLMGSWSHEFAKLAKFQSSSVQKETEKLNTEEKNQQEVQESKQRRQPSSYSEITVCMLMDRFAPN